MRVEQQLQKAVIEHLRWRGVQDIFVFHPANGGWRTAVEGAILKSMGVVPGVPDIIIINGGKVYGLELKSDAGRLTEIQRNTMQAMQRAGAIVAVAYGIDEAIKQLEDWQLLHPNAARPELSQLVKMLFESGRAHRRRRPMPASHRTAHQKAESK